MGGKLVIESCAEDRRGLFHLLVQAVSLKPEACRKLYSVAYFTIQLGKDGIVQAAVVSVQGCIYVRPAG